MPENHSFEDLKQRLAEKMAGEIILSENPAICLKKWRLNFDISQTELSKYLHLSHSVISDYESGRRKSPGISIIKKIIEAMISIDIQKGCQKIHSYENILMSNCSKESIYSTYEYSIPIQFSKLVNLLDATILYKGIEKPIYGFSIVNSHRSILEMSSTEFHRLYGWSTDRAMIFTQVSSGKSPMVAIRVTNLKPASVILHGISKSEVDPIAIKMAEVDRIPLLCTNKNLDLLTIEMRRYGQII